MRPCIGGTYLTYIIKVGRLINNNRRQSPIPFPKVSPPFAYSQILSVDRQKQHPYTPTIKKEILVNQYW